MSINNLIGKLDIYKNQSQSKVQSGGDARGSDDPKLPIANDSGKKSSFVTDNIKTRISEEPEVRSDRISEIMNQIKNGEYKVDTQKLAGKMIVESLRDDLE